MILGSSMGSPLASGLAGTGIPDCTSRGQGSDGALVLELASLAALDGGGDTGGTTGITESCSITTATYPTVEFSSIASTSIALVVCMEATDFMVEEPEDSRPTLSLVCIPAHLAALITEEPREAFPPAGSQVSVEVSTVVEDSTVVGAFMEAEAAGNSVQLSQTN